LDKTMRILDGGPRPCAAWRQGGIERQRADSPIVVLARPCTTVGSRESRVSTVEGRQWRADRLFRLIPPPLPGAAEGARS
jgi:hypothetical protein